MDLLIEQLRKNNIKFKEIPHWGIYFRKRWDDAFVHHLNESEKEKIYLLDFWYTSCLPCLKMIPILNKLFDEFKDNIEIIGVNPLESDYKDKEKLNNLLNIYPPKGRYNKDTGLVTVYE